MRMKISDAMIDAGYEAMKAEANKDGHDWEDFERVEPNQVKRLREVIRVMLQAAADVTARKSTGRLDPQNAKKAAPTNQGRGG